MELDDLIYEMNDEGWLLHGLSQYNSPKGIVWSATVRKHGSGRMPIGQGNGFDAHNAVANAWVNREAGTLEPELTYSMEKKQKVSLAGVRAALTSAGDGQPRIIRRI